MPATFLERKNLRRFHGKRSEDPQQDQVGESPANHLASVLRRMTEEQLSVWI